MLIKSADGVPIACECHGDGTTALVFIHGWSCDRSYWSKVIPRFSGEFNVVTLDLAGHGSSGDRKAWTIGTFGDDVAAVVNTLELQRVILIGHSMGGDVTLEAARRLRECVAGLIWIDTYPGNKLRSRKKQREILASLDKETFEPTVRLLVKNLFKDTEHPSLKEMQDLMSSARPEIAIPILRASFAFADEVQGALDELGLPVFAINGSHPPSESTSSTQLSGVEADEMEGVGHFPHLEAPDEFNRRLRSVIERLA